MTYPGQKRSFGTAKSLRVRTLLSSNSLDEKGRHDTGARDKGPLHPNLVMNLTSSNQCGFAIIGTSGDGSAYRSGNGAQAFYQVGQVFEG